jgi:hypothetical protein
MAPESAHPFPVKDCCPIKVVQFNDVHPQLAQIYVNYITIDHITKF